MEDLLRDFARGTQAGVDQDIGLAIKRRALFQQFADFFHRLGGLQQGAVGLIFDPFPDFFRRGPEANGQGMSFETGQIVGIDDQAAAGGDDQIFLRAEFLHGFDFGLAKGGFAVFRENFRDGGAGFVFDQFIRIDKLKLQ